LSIRRIFSIAFLVLITLESAPCKFLKSDIVSLAETDEIVTITKDDESELLNAIKKIKQ